LTDLELLKAVRRLLRDRGWVRGYFGAAKGPYCVLSAAVVETKGDNGSVDPTALAQRLAPLVGLEGGEGARYRLVRWNDQHVTSDAMFVDLDEAIARLEG
jgi:hypothetical protein